MSFKDIKGQDKSIAILKGYLASRSVKGAYLFSGPEGVGKCLIAKTFAKVLNCLTKNDDSCDTCSSCLNIERNQHPDVHFIDSSNSHPIKIEFIRDLKKDIYLLPYQGKMKVFIINDAHNLTAEAQNALLKILEEPPVNSLIILISSKPALLFKTIISRCKTIRFYPLKRKTLEELLKKDYNLDNTLAHFLAYFSDGRLGYALRLKDTDILREKNRVIDEFSVKRDLSRENLSKGEKPDLRIYLNILAAWFRDIYLLKIGMPQTELINYDRKTELLRFMGRYSLFDLDEILNFISNSLLYLEQNVNVRLLVSNLKAKLCKD